MKLIYLSAASGPDGHERAVLELAERLAAAHDVRVLRAGEPLGSGADVLVTASSAALEAAVDALPAGTALVHHADPDPLDVPAAGPLLRLAPRLDALIVTTGHAADWLRDTLGPAAPPITVVPWTPAGIPAPSAPTARAVVLAGGGRADHAVRAFAQVADRFPDWSLRIFGDGPGRRPLERLVEALDLPDRVHVLGTAPDPPGELARCGLRVVTDAAGAGRAVAEAFAAGVPVVGYARPAVAEAVTHDVDGRLVAPSDIGALAAELAAFMGDGELRSRLAAGALETARALAAEPAADRCAALFAGLRADRDGADARRDAHEARTVGAFVPAVTPVRHAGRRALLRDDLGPHDVARLNLDLVADALDAAGIGYLLVPGEPVRHRVAVFEEHRDAALAALAAHAGTPAYAQPIKPRPGTPSSGALADVAGWPPPGGLRVFHVVVPPARSLEFAADCGCDVEFWRGDGRGGRTPLRPTPAGTALPAGALDRAETAVGGRRHPTLEAFTRRRPDEVDFPIDAVYTWVDGADPAWRSRRDDALAAAGLTPSRADGGDSRYSSRDELRYSLRSLATHAPWIRRVWIVTDRQTPPWLDTGHPGVRVVDHREIFADHGALPTFNSHAIETRLHHIDGLAEHFLYLNDDFFLGRPLAPTRFFHANGLSVCFPSGTSIEPTPRADGDPTWIAAAKNNRALIEREFGRTLVHAFKHAPYALRRSVLEEIEKRFPDELAATARSRVRSVRDVSLVSSLYQYYAMCTARAVPGELSSDTVPLSRSDGMPALTRLLTLRDRDAFCLNDMASGDLDEDRKWRAATGFLANYFPVRSPFEKPV